jgi:hypothetical protein
MYVSLRNYERAIIRTKQEKTTASKPEARSLQDVYVDHQTEMMITYYCSKMVDAV